MKKQSTAKKKRNTYSDLPKNWCVLISNKLIAKGFEIKPKNVSDIKRGYYKNEELLNAYFLEVKKLKKNHQRKLSKIKKMIG